MRWNSGAHGYLRVYPCTCASSVAAVLMLGIHQKADVSSTDHLLPALGSARDPVLCLWSVALSWGRYSSHSCVTPNSRLHWVSSADTAQCPVQERTLVAGCVDRLCTGPTGCRCCRRVTCVAVTVTPALLGMPHPPPYPAGPRISFSRMEASQQLSEEVSTLQNKRQRAGQLGSDGRAHHRTTGNWSSLCY